MLLNIVLPAYDLFDGEIPYRRSDFRSLWEHKLSGMKNFQHLSMYMHILHYEKSSFNSVNKTGVIRPFNVPTYLPVCITTLMKNNPDLMRETFWILRTVLCEFTLNVFTQIKVFTQGSAAFHSVANMDDTNHFANNLLLITLIKTWKYT